MLFSIIICTKNAAKRLPKTLDSILAQNFGDFEVIIIDGASKDGTQDAIKNYEEKFGGKLKWISEKDSGIFNAMNKGVKMAQGEFLNFIGAGDWLEPDALEEAAKCIAKFSDADAVFGITRVWKKDFSKSRLLQTSPERLPAHPMQHPAIFYKKILHDKFGLYDESYRVAADYAFCLKAFYVGMTKVQSFDALVTNFVTDGVSSSNHFLCVRENFRARKEAGVSKKASLWEALRATKKELADTLLRRS